MGNLSQWINIQQKGKKLATRLRKLKSNFTVHKLLHEETGKWPFSLKLLNNLRE